MFFNNKKHNIVIIDRRKFIDSPYRFAWCDATSLDRYYRVNRKKIKETPYIEFKAFMNVLNSMKRIDKWDFLIVNEKDLEKSHINGVRITSTDFMDYYENNHIDIVKSVIGKNCTMNFDIVKGFKMKYIWETGPNIQIFIVPEDLYSIGNLENL